MIDTARTILRQGDCYRLLAVFFCEPDITSWRKEQLCASFAELMKSISTEASRAAAKMEQAIENVNEEQIMVDYAALFVGPFELLAPPYGSIYLETTRRLMGDSTMAVMKMYQDAGLAVDVKESPDHLAIELEFMHYLYTREAEAVHDGDKAKVQSLASMRKKFLLACLAGWIPRFCMNIRNYSDNVFYRNLADALESFIEQEVATLSSVSTDEATAHAYQPTV